MKKHNIFFALSFLLFSPLLQAQQTKKAKTIYQLLNLTENGCKITSQNAMVEEESVMIEEESSIGGDKANISKSKSEDPESVINKALFTKASQDAKGIFPAKPVYLSNGNYFYKDKELYGLKNNKGEVLIAPQFTAVVPDGQMGFTGYDEKSCQYYDLQGKKLLYGDYYFIKRTPLNTFIIQTKSGYGVLNALKQPFIKPGFYNIKYLWGEGILYYKVYTSPDDSYCLSSNGKDTLWANIPDYDAVVTSNGFIKISGGGIINFKTKRKLICENNYYTEQISLKHQLIAIYDPKSRNKYLIDFRGNLVSTEAFSEITSFGNRAYAVAAIPAPGSKDDSFYPPQSSLWGLLDQKGNWIIKPVYNRLYILKDDYLIATNEKEESALMTSKGIAITPFKYTNISEVNDTLLLCVSETKETVTSGLFNTKKNSIVMENLPYRALTISPLCDTTIYLAELKRDECFLNKKLERITEKNYTRIFYGPKNKYIIAADFPKDQGSIQQLYDCEGKIRTFTIENSEYKTFANYIKLSENLEHILLTDGRGYFLLSNGTTIRNDAHWQHIEDAKCNGLYITMMYGGKFGIVNDDGQTLIPPVFEYISPFDANTGLAIYHYGDKQKGYLQQDGTILFSTQYENTEFLFRDLFKVMKANQWGVVNRRGEIIIPLRYNKVELQDGLLRTESGAYDFNGKLIK